ncbi:MAG TPA: adenine phosphoribosyltransferase [Planctomycetaceae bacterium]|nr:adenine phosphoribosyltransferase [Planctomycetaceae bacterium]
MDLAQHIRSILDFPVPGINFRDITPLLENPTAFRYAVDQLVAATRSWGPVDLVAAPEARGFCFAIPVAMQWNAGFVPIRKPGKLPYKTLSKSYALEYGMNTIQMHQDAIQPGKRVLLVDDLLATGGTINACRQLIEENGGICVGAAFVMELAGLKGRHLLETPNVAALVRYEGA